jgi:hypothetical protein
MSQTSIDMSLLIEILNDHLDPHKKTEVLQAINRSLKEEEAENNAAGEGAETGDEPKEKAPKIPKKAVVFITGMPDSMDPKDLEELSGFVTWIAESEPARHVLGALKETKADYNGTKKAKKNPAKTIGELCEIAPLKLFKEHGIYKKPEGPLEFIRVPNS